MANPPLPRCCFAICYVLRSRQALLCREKRRDKLKAFHLSIGDHLRNIFAMFADIKSTSNCHKYEAL
jgi:hypothetical protein